MSACCGPSRGQPDSPALPQPGGADRGVDGGSPEAGAPERAGLALGMVQVAAGYFRMGNESTDAFRGDGEGPVREVYVSEFLIDATTVSNESFAAFIEATGYRTDAERFGWSYVFDEFIEEKDRPSVIDDGVVPGAPWWTGVSGADWRHPFGAHSSTDDLHAHPVVHVSWNDAAAYAHWVGKRLPTEAEWEKACRGGLEQQAFPWGDELEPEGEHRMNVWQGEFPWRNTRADGYLATAPADAFPPNGFGLYNTTGNVWEWVADRFSPTWHRRETTQTRQDPQGPPVGDSRVLRGGSYLCHVSYCNRYRTAGRTHNTADSSTGHMGFRCAMSVANSGDD